MKTELKLANSNENAGDASPSFERLHALAGIHEWRSNSMHLVTYFEVKDGREAWMSAHWLGRAVWDLEKSGEQQGAQSGFLKRRLKKHLAIERHTLEIGVPTGRVQTIEISAIPIFSPEGTFSGYHGFWQPVNKPKSVSPTDIPQTVIGSADFLATCYEKIAQLETPSELLSLLKEIADEMGFTSYSVLHLPDEIDRNIRPAFFATNVPPELIEEYDRNRYLDNSPVIAALRDSSKPVEYDVLNLPVHRPSEEEGPVKSLFIKHCIPRGVFYPCYDSARRKGAIAFMGERPLPERSESAILHLLSQYAFDHLHLLLSAHEKKKSLKPRELECLRLAARGKTNAECALILNVSETTIAGYYASIARKLVAANKPHMVAIALEQGIIQPATQNRIPTIYEYPHR